MVNIGLPCNNHTAPIGTDLEGTSTSVGGPGYYHSTSVGGPGYYHSTSVGGQQDSVGHYPPENAELL